MAREGFTTLLCALVLLPPLSLGAADDARDAAVATTLAVQQALREGTEHVERGHYGGAVHVLESQLPRINGNRVYLARLRDAYRGYVKELRLAGRDAEAQTYLKRLEILDPGARLDFDAVRPAENKSAAAVPPVPPPAPAAPTTAELAAASGTASPGPKAAAVVRGVREDDRPSSLKDDPFHPKNQLSRNPAPAVLERAEQEWKNGHYDAAGRLFEQAHQADPAGTAGVRDKMAYCRLHGVVQLLNLPSDEGVSYPRLEEDVRTAMSLSPKVEEQGKFLLGRIQERQARAGPAPAAATVGHREASAGGWAVAETANFRVFHTQGRDYAERVARAAEAARADASRKWFGDDGGTWGARCDVYLHAAARDYARATGKPEVLPGHSTISSEGARVVGRRIDLHCDDPGLLVSSLPHEATHAVLAGRFGGADLPRWADEGMAVLSEPREKIEAHLRGLPRHRQDGLLFGVRELLTRENYPEARRVNAFYSESVSLTQYLVAQGGPQTFARFLNEALRYGYDRALQRHYGLDVAALEQRWGQAAFAGETAQAGYSH